MIDSEIVYDEASKKMGGQKSTQQRDTLAREELERSIQEALGGKDDEIDEDLE